jgi:hypothetical protein
VKPKIVLSEDDLARGFEEYLNRTGKEKGFKQVLAKAIKAALEPHAEIISSRHEDYQPYARRALGFW